MLHVPIIWSGSPEKQARIILRIYKSRTVFFYFYKWTIHDDRVNGNACIWYCGIAHVIGGAQKNNDTVIF